MSSIAILKFRPDIELHCPICNSELDTWIDANHFFCDEDCYSYSFYNIERVGTLHVGDNVITIHFNTLIMKIFNHISDKIIHCQKYNRDDLLNLCNAYQLLE